MRQILPGSLVKIIHVDRSGLQRDFIAVVLEWKPSSAEDDFGKLGDAFLLHSSGKARWSIVFHDRIEVLRDFSAV